MILFTTIEEFKNYVAIDAQTDIDTLKPYIEEAQIEFMEDLLGETFLSSLLTDYNSVPAGEVTGDNLALLPYVQRPLAYYTMFLAIDILSVNVGDAGITETRGQNTDPAPKWKVDSLKLRSIGQGDKHAEKLLQFLERQASPSKYNAWYSSSANTTAGGLIVRTAAVATEHIDIDNSRRIFRRLKKRVREIESGLVKRLIGAAQYDEIVSQVKSDSLTPGNETLVGYLKPIIAKKALYETMPSLRLTITENGLTIFSSNDTLVTKSAASKEDVKHLMHSLKDSESGYLADIEKLKQFIIDNITGYPAIEASTAFTSRPDPGPKRPPVNDRNAKHFSV